LFSYGDRSPGRFPWNELWVVSHDEGNGNATSCKTSHAIILPENVWNKLGIMYYAT